MQNRRKKNAGSAIIVVSLLAIILMSGFSVSMNFIASLQNRRILTRYDKGEAFFSSEIAVWANYLSSSGDGSSAPLAIHNDYTPSVVQAVNLSGYVHGEPFGVAVTASFDFDKGNRAKNFLGRYQEGKPNISFGVRQLAGRKVLYGEMQLKGRYQVGLALPSELLATHISAGVESTCAIFVGGSVKCWGRNDSGQLGNGSRVASAVPVQVQNLTSGATAVSVGPGGACAVVNGRAYCWGGNGILGHGSISVSTGPVKVQDLSSGVTDIAVSELRFCAVANKELYCWGAETTWATPSSQPILVQGLTSETAPLAPGAKEGVNFGVTAVAIEMKSYNTCAIVNGGAKCWGLNSGGQLGNNSIPYVDCFGEDLPGSNNFTEAENPLTDYFLHVPVQVVGLTAGVTAIGTGGAMEGGGGHTCAIVNGGVQCWGSNCNGRLGINTKTLRSHIPVQTEGLRSEVTGLSMGPLHDCVVIDGAAKCWGLNGLSGNSSYTTGFTYLPVQVEGLTEGVTAIAVGVSHSCAIAKGKIFCWGSNYYGELGDDSHTARVVPVPVCIGCRSGGSSS